MKDMKKVVCLVLVVMSILAVSIPAFAGSIVTPNGGRAKLWSTSTTTTSYKAYISSGNDATLLNNTASSGRYNVKAYGYNSSMTYGYYKGWINTDYYVD